MDWFTKLDKTVRIILLIPIWGWLISGILRILKYTESKNTTTLVIGILCLLIAPVGFVLSILDLVSTIQEDKLKYFID